MSPALLQQLTLAILDGSPDEGHRVITTIRSCLDTWEIFLQDRQQLRDHLVTAHHAGSSCLEADPASLNRASTGKRTAATWPASWPAAHPVQV